jgi:DNA-binding response OmpR family regulator
MRLMLVDDDRIFGTALLDHLTGEGYAVDWIRAGRGFDPAVMSQGHECLLLGLSPQDARGAELLGSMRALIARIPSLVISAGRALADRVALLDMGADDILVKPVDLPEVSARIRAVTRRKAKHDASVAETRIGPLALDASNRTATWHDRNVALTGKEFWVLEMLVRNRHRILSRSQLEETLYGWRDEIESNAVEVYVHHLRRKFCPQLISTFRGLGYQLGSADSLN